MFFLHAQIIKYIILLHLFFFPWIPSLIAVSDYLCFPFSLLSFWIAALQEQRNASGTGIDSTVGESSSLDRVPSKENPGFNMEQIPGDGESFQGIVPPCRHDEFHIESGNESAPSIEHEFIARFTGKSPVHQHKCQGESMVMKNLCVLRNGSDDESCVSLQLGEQNYVVFQSYRGFWMGSFGRRLMDKVFQ